MKGFVARLGAQWSSKLQFLLVLLLAAVVAVGLFIYTSGVESRAIKSQQLVNVLVATGTIQSGTSLFQAQQSGLIEVRQFPISSRPLNAIDTSIAGKENQVALKTIEAGQLILNSNFGEALVYAGGLDIPKGYVAITVKTDVEARVGYFLEPGSIVVAYTTGQVGNANPITKIIVSSAKVIAVGGKVRTESGIQSVFQGDDAMITLAVTPSSAIRLVSASQSFPIYLGLLGEGTSINPNDSLSITQLLTSSKNNEVSP
ncbi:MAG: Flp pilus assembly protein CpaB [Candidatus Nanopelagicaceae bacterium]